MSSTEDSLSTSPTAVTMGAHLATLYSWEQKNNHVKHVSPEESTTIRSMTELVDRIPEAVQRRKMQDTPPGASNDPIIHLFRNLDLSPREWEAFSFFNPDKPYTRNLIATDHTTYTLLLLCWNPGQESPIHDHPCDGCWLRVLQGSVRECRYSTQDLDCIAEERFEQGEIAYITDSMGYHKIGNPTETQPAVTLHLYAPPIQTCRVWGGRIGDHNRSDSINPTPKIATSCHYSEYGHVLK